MRDIAQVKKEVLAAGKKLTKPRREFIDHYMSHSSLTWGEAYMFAYPKSARRSARANASRALEREDIRRYYELKVELRTLETQIDANWVLNQAVKVHNRCMQVAPVIGKDGKQVLVNDSRGDLVPAFTFDSTGANKSLEIVGKHVNVQAFKENISIEHNENLTPWSDIEAGVDEKA